MKNYFGKNQVEGQPGEPKSPDGMEELRLGKFSPFPEEIERVRKEAEARGEDPDLAEKRFRQKLDEATARLRTSQQEEALKSLEESGKRKSQK